MKQRIIDTYHAALKAVVNILALVAGLAVLGMMLVTAADVIMRRFDHPVTGAMDIVSILGAVAIACALPYTTAVEGHVAIEYFFHKLPNIGRVIVDTLLRLTTIALFVFLAWASVAKGVRFWRTHLVSQTLQMPLFWLPWIIALSCITVALVILYNLTHPGRTMLKP